MCPSTTPFCHSLNRLGSVTYAKTSAAGRSTSVLVTIGDMSASLLDQRRVAVQVQRPAFRSVDSAQDRFPAGTVPVDVPVLKLNPRARRRLGGEPHLYLAGQSRIGLDCPLGADIPAEYHPVRRLEDQDPRPPALTAVRCPVHDVASDDRFEYRRGDRRPQHVVLGRLEVTEPVGEHRESMLYRCVDDHLLTHGHRLWLGHHSSLLCASVLCASTASA